MGAAGCCNESQGRRRHVDVPSSGGDRTVVDGEGMRKGAIAASAGCNKPDEHRPERQRANNGICRPRRECRASKRLAFYLLCWLPVLVTVEEVSDHSILP